jgi:uncharacterized damage-inducible protein DinB/GNAT superfamily N-acetyltransferase
MSASTAHGVEIRLLAARDSVELLTELVRQAYAPLAERGLVMPEATQTAAATQLRMAAGQCFVAAQRGRIVGTVTVGGLHDTANAPGGASGSFRHRDTAHFHQFAVAPDRQRLGVGRRLVAACEQWARERGYKRMAIETAEPATQLLALYRRLGYVEVSHTQPPGQPHRNLILEKPLDQSPLREQLRLLARYNLWATRELWRQVEVLPDADYRRDLGLFFKSVHGTLNHLLLAEHEIWYRRFAEGSSPVTRLDVELEADRQALKERLVEGALAWLPLIEVWPEARLLGKLDYHRVGGEPTSLPFAAALTHVFNHATHHRGQVSAALTILGRQAPELDLSMMLRQEAAQPAQPAQGTQPAQPAGPTPAAQP